MPHASTVTIVKERLWKRPGVPRKPTTCEGGTSQRAVPAFYCDDGRIPNLSRCHSLAKARADLKLQVETGTPPMVAVFSSSPKHDLR